MKKNENLVMGIFDEGHMKIIGILNALLMWWLIFNNYNPIVFILGVVIMYFETRDEDSRMLKFVISFVAYMTFFYTSSGIILLLLDGLSDYPLHLGISKFTESIILISYILAIPLWMANTRLATNLYRLISKKMKKD